MAVLGPGSPSGGCIWHVVGLQRSVREWAMRQGWGGRPVRIEQAQVFSLLRLASWRGTTATNAEPSIYTGNLVRQSSH
jgi:hypothetical protein